VSAATGHRPARVMVAKLGLDGHDRGAKLVVRLLRDAGMEVIYTGLRRTPAQVVAAAVDEDVDVLGLSVLSGAHIALVEQVLQELRAADADDIPVVLGGTVSSGDARRLLELGVSEVFPVRSDITTIPDRIRALAGADA
jgi:methylmalonyl-CoA mutase C-terminal domain/subunit